MQYEITFPSDGLKLSGVIHKPDGMSGKRPAVIVTHGFGGTKGGTHEKEAALYEAWGYVVLRFDYRGCGDSEGKRGNIICTDQVADTRNAVSFMAAQDFVDADRIMLSGQSFGAAINVYTGSVDSRVKAVVSIGGWGDGLEKSKDQHPSPEQWAAFTGKIAEGRAHREKTGESFMVKRWDIVPIPEHMRGHLPSGAVMDFTSETMESICTFRPNEVVSLMAPRPMLLVHSANDSVTPTRQAIELFQKAGKGCELHLLSEIDHFPFTNGDSMFIEILNYWLKRNFPVNAS